MSTEMNWSPDYCLSCDRQITEGTYCSQACRLADLEKAGTSEANSPLSTSASSSTSYTSTHSGAHSHSGFYLPPAVNFNTYNSSTRQSHSYPYQYQSSATNTNQYYYSPSSPTYSTYIATDSQSQSKRLSASSSHSSLASTANYQTSGQVLTPQAASALQGYVSSFDQVRESKRRYRS